MRQLPRLAGRSSTIPARPATASAPCSRRRTLSTRIPAGVSDGQRIRLAGKGEPGSNGGPAGDLFVVVHVAAHELFGRNGDNLTLTVPVTFPELALGATLTVPTLDRLGQAAGAGRAPRPGGSSGSRARAYKRKDSTGDLIVTVEVAVPQRLSAEAKRRSRPTPPRRPKIRGRRSPGPGSGAMTQ